jgi:hypothetical protein
MGSSLKSSSSEGGVVMRKNAVMWICYLAVALVSGLVLFCSPKPADVVQSYQQAHNDGDLEKLLSLYADDVQFEIVGQVSLQGKEKIRHLAEHDFALNIHMSIDQLVTHGDTVQCQLTETNDWLKTAGIPEARYTGFMVIEKGFIQSIRAELVPESDRAFKRVLVPLMEWGSKERPQQVAEMMPQGQFVYNAENANRSLALLQEWKQAARRQAIRPSWRKIGD